MKQPEMWVSKWALTVGIAKVSGTVGGSGIYFYPAGFCSSCKIGTDAHATEEAAKAAAESMRVKKIASLRKQIAKLEVMKF